MRSPKTRNSLRDLNEELKAKKAKLKCEICDLNQFDNMQELSKHMHIEHKRKLLLPRCDKVQSESQKMVKNAGQSPGISSPGITAVQIANSIQIQIQKIPLSQGFRSEPIITSRPILRQPVQSQNIQGQNISAMLSNLVPISLPPKKVPIPRKTPVYKEGGLKVFVKEEAPAVKEEPKDCSEDPLSFCSVFIKEETD